MADITETFNTLNRTLFILSLYWYYETLNMSNDDKKWGIGVIGFFVMIRSKKEILHKGYRIGNSSYWVLEMNVFFFFFFKKSFKKFDFLIFFKKLFKKI